MSKQLKTTSDKHDIFELELASSGSFEAAGVYVYGAVRLMKLASGKMMALNYASADPSRLKSRDLRAQWARLNGLAPAQVELYVRRKKDADRRASLREAIVEATDLLRSHGFDVQSRRTR